MIKRSKNHKLRVAIISLTSCEGCQFVMLDQGKRFLDWLGEVELEEFRMIDDKQLKMKYHDLCLVEGNPVTPANMKLLKELRKYSKVLVVVGNCAALGGVWEIKNYQDKEKVLRHVYQKTKVPNTDIKEVGNVVKVDFTIPCCPIVGKEFMEALYMLLDGRMPKISQNPVCYECQNNGYECLLQKGEICLGPITLGGCEAVCLKSKQACWGCRGVFEGAQLINFIDYLLDNYSREQVYRVMEVFGARDTIMKALSNDEKKIGLAKKKKTKNRLPVKVGDMVPMISKK